MRPLQHLSDTPRSALNWRLFYAIAVVGLLGISRGGDEGTVGSMTGSKAWQNEYHVAKGSSQQSNVVSMVQLGNVPGSLFTFLLVDRIGRVHSIQVLCLIWIIGTVIWITSNGSVGQTLAGRFIAGLGIGGFPVVCPTMLAEIAPRTVRGLAMTTYSSSVYIGIVIGYAANLGSQRGFSTYDSRVWKVPVSINFIYAGLFFFGSFFLRESPRAMARKQQFTQALETLAWYRGMPTDHPYVQEEWSAIQEEVEHEARAKHGKTFVHLLKELFTNPANLKKLFVISVAIQLLGQWSGGGSLTIYAEQILLLVGVESNASLYTTLVFGIVKLASALICSLFLIDVLGRKKSVFIGIGLQTLAALYLCIYVAKIGDPDSTSEATESASQERAGIAAVVMVFLSGVGWAMGFNAIQYLIGTEIWQTELRALATSIIMAVHFANQYGSSRALQPMLQGMDRWGLFAFWTAIGVTAAVYIALFVPETAGRSLESMDQLFHGPWYKMGMANNHVTHDESTRAQLSGGHAEDAGSETDEKQAQQQQHSVDDEKDIKERQQQQRDTTRVAVLDAR